MENITIGDFILCDNVHKSGSVFLLSKKVKSVFKEKYSKKIGIWEISIRDKSKLIVVKTKRKIKPENIFKLTYKVAQEFLDFVSVEIRHFNFIINPQNHILWYEDNNQKFLHITSRSAVNVTSRTQVKIKPVDKRKKSRILRNDLDKHHPALRYFRLSRNNKDFIDAFRNLYLAFEQLLSSLTPRITTPKYEQERVWIERGLTNSKKQNELAKVLKCNNTSVIATEFISQIYEVRNALFHAKTGDTVYLPKDLIYKKRIINSLQTLEYVNWILLDEYYNTTIARGGMVISGLQQIANNFCNKEKQFKILISDKIDKLKADGTLEDEMIQNHLIQNADFNIEYCSSKIYTDFDINTVLSKFSNLSRVCVFGSGGLYQILQLENPIKLTEIIDILRVYEYNDVTSEDFHQFFY